MDDWIDHTYYWEHKYSQKSVDWKKIKLKVLSSTDASVALQKNIYKTKEELQEEIKSGRRKVLNNIHIERGVYLEPYVRKWYENYTNSKVYESGLCINKNNMFIGASPDGIVKKYKGNVCDDRLIEIKCPSKLYLSIKNGNIPEYHYIQIQVAMFCTNKSICDYIVYSDNTIVIITVPFDQLYWDNNYPEIDKFIKEIGIVGINV